MRALEPGGAVVLNNSAVSMDWSLGIGHFALGLYRALFEARPDVSWRLAVPPGQGGIHRARLSAPGLTCHDFAEAGPLRALGAPGRLAAAAVRRLAGGEAAWWHRLARGAALEFCPSQVTQAHTRLPSVLTCHDLHPWNVPWQYPDPENLKAIVSRNLARADAVVVCWPHPYQEVLDRFPEHRDKTFLIPFPVLVDPRPVDEEEARAVRAEYGLEGRFLLYPSRLQPHKNHRLLLEAFARTRMPGVRLVCPGSAWSEEYRQELRALAEKLGVTDRVLFPGHIPTDKLQALYALCDAVVAPTLAEATSAALVEGFAQGKPVAASAIPPLLSFAEWIGGDVRFFNPSSPEDMAEAMVEVMEAPARWRQGAHEAGVRLRRFSWPETARRNLDVFAWVLRGAPRNERPSWRREDEATIPASLR